jgi:hypothetical protein
LSVFFVGIVQLNEAVAPLRSALKSATGAGSFSDGGCGGPGVPHPAKTNAHASAGQPQLCRDPIASQSTEASGLTGVMQCLAFQVQDAARLLHAMLSLLHAMP